jgi:hypothetical protein
MITREHSCVCRPLHVSFREAASQPTFSCRSWLRRSRILSRQRA